MNNRELIKETFAGDPDRLRLFLQFSEGLFACEEARRECEAVLAELEAENKMSAARNSISKRKADLQRCADQFAAEPSAKTRQALNLALLHMHEAEARLRKIEA